ncbi:acetyl-CoA carboxylase carboxyltransferase component [Allocatelliglobosispora scoriae]|uniref:Acetyl-CoA carboxylase carboxyltransferase component n=1 Tax=Allocatelliglobosispora scoriae TaxID=643052 RepID=A0A841BWT2_9ACTN|nr:acetyl-CoA carboxylase carboxyltransferase component [Allocatelliglobosispora scoriae]
MAELDAAIVKAREGGGEKQVTRHHARGKLLPRERIELLLDRDTAFLELSTIAGFGTGHPVGAGVVTGIGVVEGTECVIIASDPTVRGGAVNAYSLLKMERAAQIAADNGLPLVSLIESDGLDPSGQAEALLPGGAVLGGQARLRGRGSPSICAIFGIATAAGMSLPALADQVILVRGQARVHLAGSHVVRAATGEVVDEEALGGATLHATRTGLADLLAEDERDALRLVRHAVRRLRTPRTASPPGLVAPPKYDADDLIAVAAATSPARETLARILDGSEFDEVAPLFGEGLVTGWGSVHGHPIGVIASDRPMLGVDEIAKALRFIEISAPVPLVLLVNSTGFAVGGDDESRGIAVSAARLVRALANTPAPLITIVTGSAHGPGGQALGGRGMNPRFLLSWPTARASALPPAQVLAIAEHRSLADDGEPDHPVTALRLEEESSAMRRSGLLADDGIIDPRDTRTVLGICLSSIHRGAASEGNRP